MENKEDILAFLEGKLSDVGIVLTKTHKKQIRHAANEMNALPDSVIKFLNSNLNKVSDLLDKPEWLDDIDRFFDERNTTSKPRLQSFHLHRFFPDVIALMAPIVSLEHIVAMKSFNIDFISSLELAFISRLDLPRNVDEAKRFYDYVLSLPSEKKFRLFKFRSKYDDPYRSQMLFTVLIMQESKPNSELWNYQLECLKKCPKYLLDYGSIYENGLSYRPSFWMAGYVFDKEFRKILTQRASDQYKVDLQQELKFEASKFKAKEALVVNDSSMELPLKQKTSESQFELVERLNRFEKLLKEDHPDVFRSLKPSASQQKIEKLNEALAPLRLPEDFSTLYKWHDGINYDGYLFGFPDFLSTEDALQQYRQAIEIGSDYCWCKAWFTMSYESRVFLLIPLSESVQESSPIYYHDIEGGDIEIYFESINQFIQTYMEAYSKGVIILDKESGYRELDHEAFEEIRIKHNPNAYQSEKNQEACYQVDNSSKWPNEWKKYMIGQEAK